MPNKKNDQTEKIMRLLRRHMWLLLLIGLLLPVMAPVCEVMAAPEDCSVTISYPWEGITVQLFRIGESDKQGNYDLDAMFDDFQVDMESSEAAATLAGYIRREQLLSDQEILTDSEGLAAFKELKEGVYLILAEEMETEQGILVTSPVMIELPRRQDGQEVRDIMVQGKYEVKKPEVTELTVIKNWKNDDEKKRPESITVQLVKDGDTVVEEVVLNKDCSWTKTWENLEAGHVWSVLEKDVPDGYHVSISTNGSKNAIINKGNEDRPHKPGDRLPQTGQTWWMVPMMIAVGLFLILLGLLLRPKHK